MTTIILMPHLVKTKSAFCITYVYMSMNLPFEHSYMLLHVLFSANNPWPVFLNNQMLLSFNGKTGGYLCIVGLRWIRLQSISILKNNLTNPRDGDKFHARWLCLLLGHREVPHFEKENLKHWHNLLWLVVSSYWSTELSSIMQSVCWLHNGQLLCWKGLRYQAHYTSLNAEQSLGELSRCFWGFSYFTLEMSGL